MEVGSAQEIWWIKSRDASGTHRALLEIKWATLEVNDEN